jgi:hypothetical protein
MEGLRKTSVQTGDVTGISQVQVQRINAALSYVVSRLKSNSVSMNFI